MGTRTRGRPPGFQLFKASFERELSQRQLLRKDVAEDAGVSAQFLTDLVYSRCGAPKATAERIAGAMGVPVALLFPAFDGWTGPGIDRDGRKEVA